VAPPRRASREADPNHTTTFTIRPGTTITFFGGLPPK
jgi:hypothetical protein